MADKKKYTFKVVFDLTKRGDPKEIIDNLQLDIKEPLGAEISATSDSNKFAIIYSMYDVAMFKTVNRILRSSIVLRGLSSSYYYIVDDAGVVVEWESLVKKQGILPEDMFIWGAPGYTPEPSLNEDVTLTTKIPRRDVRLIDNIVLWKNNHNKKKYSRRKSPIQKSSYIQAALREAILKDISQLNQDNEKETGVKQTDEEFMQFFLDKDFAAEYGWKMPKEQNILYSVISRD
ncbi:hypothetical protein Mpsy_3148 [Methanolobus psychrophilus R15]|nr:hypothetical protein Mpsy_3148 [Methanolobus psychrophilus R15]